MKGAKNWTIQTVVVERTDPLHQWWTGIVRIENERRHRAITFAWSYECYEGEGGTDCYLTLHPGGGEDAGVAQGAYEALAQAIAQEIAKVYE